jgi:AraC-like DNA-binding protein
VVRRLPDDEALAPAADVRVRRPLDAALRQVVSCFWVTTVPDAVRVLRVLPDAATDLVFTGDRLHVAGPDTTACLERLPRNAVVLGCQVRPAAVPAVLGVPASACRDQRVDLAELWGADGRGLGESMAESGGVDAAALLLERVLARRMRGERTRDASTALPGYATGDERTLLRWGLSERQTRRLSDATYGYGPRTLRRVLRFRSAVDTLREQPRLPLAELATMTGYTDQSHLTHDVIDLAGLTPHGLRTALARTR